MIILLVGGESACQYTRSPRKLDDTIRSRAPKIRYCLSRANFEMLSTCASGDLMQPAHNELYQRPGLQQTIMAVPLGCGQLASGVSSGRRARHAPIATPPCHLCGQPFRHPPRGICRIKGLAFRDHRPGQVQQVPRGRTTGDFARLARRAQALVLGFDDRIEPSRA
jgi:hypothetical protein